MVVRERERMIVSKRQRDREKGSDTERERDLCSKLLSTANFCLQMAKIDRTADGQSHLRC